MDAVIDFLFSFGFFTFVVASLTAVGIGVLALAGSDDFKIAKACFVGVGLYSGAEMVYLAVRHGNWDSYPLFGLLVTGCLWFSIEAASYVDRKREDKLAKEVRTDREAFIIRQLEQFIAEERQIHTRSESPSAWLSEFGMMFTFRGKVEHFLALHLSNEHVTRFQKNGVYALQEMIKELLDDRLLAPPGLSAPAIKTREDIINDLGLFRDEASALLAKAVDGRVSGLSRRVAEWERKVGDYLGTYVDVSNKTEFLLDSGMEHYVSTIDYSKVERRFRPNPQFLDRIHTRLLRLKRIIKRIGEIEKRQLS